jgi:hypothetical protein
MDEFIAGIEYHIQQYHRNCAYVKRVGYMHKIDVSRFLRYPQL